MSTKRAASQAAPLVSRAVHIKLSPATRNIQESRDILRFLKSYGDVTSFRNLRYDAETFAPHTIVAVFREAGSAQKLMAASPLQVTVGKTPSWPKEPHELASKLPSLFRTAGNESKDEAKGSTDAETEPVTISMQVNACREALSNQIRRQEFYWGCNEPIRTMAQEELARQVPLEGLATIKALPGTLFSRIVKQKQAAVDERLTLRQLYEQGMEAKLTSNDPLTD